MGHWYLEPFEVKNAALFAPWETGTPFDRFTERCRAVILYKSIVLGACPNGEMLRLDAGRLVISFHQPDRRNGAAKFKTIRPAL